MMSRTVVYVLLLLIALSAAAGENVSSLIPLPFNVDTADIKPLRSLEDERLQAIFKQHLYRNPSWKKLMDSKKMAVGLVDISDPDRVLFASINGDDMMYAASLPKIAILLAAFYYFEDGSLKETPEIMADLNLMIRKSNNGAASRMIKRIGMDRIWKVLTLKEYALYDPENGGGLWVGKYYAQGGPRKPEPMKGISHAATVSQVCRFYYLLSMGKLVSWERSRQMLDILSDPGIDHKFVKALKTLVPKAVLLRKSGTWKTWHSDSVLVWGPEWRRYIAVALVDSTDGETILRKLIPVLEKVLKENSIKPKSDPKSDPLIRKISDSTTPDGHFSGSRSS